jgi:hypothetical protein
MTGSALCCSPAPIVAPYSPDLNRVEQMPKLYHLMLECEGNRRWTACPCLHTQAVGLGRKQPPPTSPESRSLDVVEKTSSINGDGMCCRTVASVNGSSFDQVALLAEQAIGVRLAAFPMPRGREGGSLPARSAY